MAQTTCGVAVAMLVPRLCLRCHQNNIKFLRYVRARYVPRRRCALRGPCTLVRRAKLLVAWCSRAVCDGAERLCLVGTSTVAMFDDVFRSKFGIEFPLAAPFWVVQSASLRGTPVLRLCWA